MSAVRPATEADIDGLARLWHEAWIETHAPLVPDALNALRTLDDFRARLPALLPDLRTAGQQDAPLGLCITRADEMHQLFLAPEARGTGLASDLLADAERRMSNAGVRKAWLDVLIENHRAIRFYQREGWQLGARTDMPLDTAEGVGTFTLHVQVMTKDLGQGA